MTYLVGNCGRSVRRIGSGWSGNGEAQPSRGPRRASAQRSPMRSAISEATPDAVGCSSTLATADGMYPIGASQPGCDGVRVWTWLCMCG